MDDTAAKNDHGRPTGEENVHFGEGNSGVQVYGNVSHSTITINNVRHDAAAGENTPYNFVSRSHVLLTHM